MDCEKFRDMLDNYENLTEEERLMLTKHTTECAECRAELDFMNAILKVTKSLPEIKYSRRKGTTINGLFSIM